MQPEIWIAIALQIPLVAVVAWAFTTGRVHSDAELKRREKDHQAELGRRTDTMRAQVEDWRTLYQQERSDRLRSDERLSTATGELKEVTARVEELTKEVIRNGRS